MTARIIPPGEVLRENEQPAPPTPEGARRPSGGQKAASDRFSSINAFVDLSMRDLTRAESLVWVALWRDTRAGVAKTSMTYLQRRLGVNRTTIVRALQTLRLKGFVEVVRRGARGCGSNWYRLRATPEG